VVPTVLLLLLLILLRQSKRWQCRTRGVCRVFGDRAWP